MTGFRTLKICALIWIVTAFSSVSSAQAFQLLLAFDLTDGERPVDTPMVQGVDGELYGTTLAGGAHASGTIFKISPSGKLTTIYSFCAQSKCADGSGPYAGLTVGSDGNFYGTTETGGNSTEAGTIFRFTPAGELTTLYSFSGSDGFSPLTPLVQGEDGDYYGTTQTGGESNSGTIFKITASGAFTSLYAFGSDGEGNSTAPLVQASDGNFYGTSEIGGANSDGTVFKITPTGTFSTLYSFSGTDGQSPAGGLVQGRDGELYGVTYMGGVNDDGTVFKITLSGALTTLHNFSGSDGSYPVTALIQATDGNFYGTTYGGGVNGWGTLYEMSPAGTITILHSFTGGDGAHPYAPLAQSTGGSFYGTAISGTTNAPWGTAFRLETGLGPFVKLVQPSRWAGEMVGIIGQGFIGTSSVSFNGVSAAFMIRSGSYIAATVPAGATTGFVTVTTSTGTLQSDVPLKIVP